MLINDQDYVKKMTLFYCGTTSIIFFPLIFVLLKTELYLFLGSRKMYPLFIFLICFEILKWSYNVFMNNSQKYFKIKKKSCFNIFRKRVSGQDIVRSTFLICTCCFGYYLIAILFGAALFNKQEETLMFSVLLTHLTALPMILQFRSLTIKHFLRLLNSNNRLNYLIKRNAQFAIIGAWFGAFVIPLDWDRKWQVWPIPCSVGALIGYYISNNLQFIHMIAINFSMYRKMYLKLSTLISTDIERKCDDSFYWNVLFNGSPFINHVEP